MRRKVTWDAWGSAGIPTTVLTGSSGFNIANSNVSACRVVLGHVGRLLMSKCVTCNTWLLKCFLDNFYKQGLSWKFNFLLRVWNVSRQKMSTWLALNKNSGFSLIWTDILYTWGCISLLEDIVGVAPCRRKSIRLHMDSYRSYLIRPFYLTDLAVHPYRVTITNLRHN